ncbi:hypothetical protein G7046_g2774 [Stylonectria norvegica]|nr:hypothetical protein G7046_g2774 [Stylonectria norvegica]
MSVASSPLQDVTRLLRRRNLSTIPKDQQKLLDEANSWAAGLKGQPRGQAHVPGHVLETMKEAYKVQHEPKTRTPARAGSRNSARPSSTSKTHDQSGKQNGSSPIQEVHSQEPRSSPEVVIEDCCAYATAAATRHLASPAFNDDEFPPSEAEEELETELPDAQTIHDVPINRTATTLRATVASSLPSSLRPMDTPPCAQGTQPTQAVIPNTVVQEPTERDLAVAEKRRRRPMKPIQFSDGTPRKALPAPNRLPSANVFVEIESSNSTTSSSIIPATYQEPVVQDSMLDSAEVESSMDVEVQDSMVDSADVEASMDVDVKDEEVDEAPMSATMVLMTEPPPSLSVVALQEIREPTQETSQQLTQISLDGETKPFEAFSLAYPAFRERYSGTLWDFIKACVCLEYYRKDRLLRECLYDDFIRAFAGKAGYQHYANSAGPDQEALVAIEWYNNLSGPSIFNRMVVTQENLGYILDFYPKEVAQVRKLIIDEHPPDKGSPVEKADRNTGTNRYDTTPGTFDPGTATSLAASRLGFHGAFFFNADDNEEKEGFTTFTKTIQQSRLHCWGGKIVAKETIIGRSSTIETAFSSEEVHRLP